MKPSQRDVDFPPAVFLLPLEACYTSVRERRKGAYTGRTAAACPSVVVALSWPHRRSHAQTPRRSVFFQPRRVHTQIVTPHALVGLVPPDQTQVHGALALARVTADAARTPASVEIKANGIGAPAVLAREARRILRQFPPLHIRRRRAP